MIKTNYQTIKLNKGENYAYFNRNENRYIVFYSKWFINRIITQAKQESYINLQTSLF